MGQKPKKWTLLDGLLAVLIAAFLVYIAYRLKVGLNYRWHWSAIPQYLLRFDPQSGRWTPNLLLKGFFTTIRLSLWATLLATVLGILAGFWRISRWKKGNDKFKLTRNIFKTGRNKLYCRCRASLCYC